MSELEQLQEFQGLPHHRMWQLLDIDHYPEIQELKENTILTLFKEQVKKHPEKNCVLFRDQVLTYGDLHRKSTAIGLHLHKMGIGPEDRVAIIAERSLEMVAAVYGVLMAGAAYVPIDKDYPPERIAYILEDAAPKAVLLYRTEFLTEIPTVDLSIDFSTETDDCLLQEVFPESLAYLIYTSGTSGKPKGVMIEHRNVVNYSLQSGQGVLRYLKEGDSIVSLTNFVFDIFVTELLMAPLLGMTVILADEWEQINAEALGQLMKRHPAAIMQTTPSRVQLYLSQKHGEEVIRSFSYMMLGGEPVPAQLVRRLHNINPTARIIDVYGPSETTVWSTCADVTEGEVTIGTPITNTQVYILDGLDPCPIGKAGELCIGGAGVARGYLNRPELTAEKFIPNPFGQGRIYRTGDLAAYRPDGNLDYLGRIDDQVKIRGTRIELGEIDGVLREIPVVKDCAVVAQEDANGEKEIYAFVVSDCETLDLYAIRRKMKAFLPESMIPAYFRQVDVIPLTPNGKLDKRALPYDVEPLTERYLAPNTETERLICNSFEEILGVNKVGATDNFFDLGGHSLRLVRLQNKLREAFGCDISQSQLFVNPTPRKIAVLLSDATHSVGEALCAHADVSYLPASPAQRRIFYHIQHWGDDYSYHLISVYSLDGNLNLERFREVFYKIVERHEILRTVFCLEKGEPYQKILPVLVPELTQWNDPFEDPKNLVSQWLRPFDLSTGPLLRGGLIKKDDQYYFLLDMHHIISDGISEDLFCTELAALYDGNPAKEAKLQYKDYCIWSSERDIQSQREYWLSQFRTIPPSLALPTDYNRKVATTRKGEVEDLLLSEKLSMGIRRFAQEHSVSEYMVFLSAAFILLSRHSGQEDLVIGSAFSGRMTSEAENMLGMFAATLPIRAIPKKEMTFDTFLQEICERCIQSQDHQEYPFDELVRELALHRDLSRNPLFDVMLVMQNRDAADYINSSINLKLIQEFHPGTTFDLTFNVEEVENSFRISLQYACDLFSKNTARLLLEHFETLLHNILLTPKQCLGKLSMISSKEEALLNSFRNTDSYFDEEATISELLERQVRNNPQAVAIICGNKSITYGEFNRKANVLARRLRNEGVGPDVPVALLLPQSIERFIGIYAVLKAGGIYIPIDPKYPQERISYILENSKTKILLALSGCETYGSSILCLDEPNLWNGNGEDLPQIAHSDDIAYCIYTSGTTGKPKGVMVPHKGISNLKSYFENVLYITPNDRILQFANYVFDGSVWEMNMALLTGATLVLVTDQTDIIKIRHTMEHEKVSVASFPPNLFAQLQELPARILVTAGSSSGKKIVELASDCRYINSYGPTECTVAVTHWEGALDYDFVPIGKAIPNVKVYILRGTEPCAIGVPGEICISSVGLARGYLGLDEMTERCFISNPFGPGKLYRTGDLGLQMADGNIRFLGRVDDQIKVRGYRVELAEIEVSLRNLPYVLDCAVTVSEDADGENTVFAYFVSDDSVSYDRVRKDLRKMLPEYMIPSYFMQLDQMPVNQNGKVDKSRLPQMTLRSDSEYIPPSTPAERALIQAVEEVFSLEHISIKDSFFELGGDSIKAIQMVSSLREKGLAITVRDIMESANIEEMALYVEETKLSSYPQTEVVGEIEDTPMLNLFRHWRLAAPSYFNQAIIRSTDATEEELRIALDKLVEHHDILRSVYRNDRLTMIPYKKDMGYELYIYKVPLGEYEAKWIEDACTHIQSQMNLQQGPLVKAALFETANERIVMIAIHHLVIDSVSWHVIMEDLDTVITQCRQGKKPQLPLKTMSFQQWAKALGEYRCSEDLKKEAPYWDAVHRALTKDKLLIPQEPGVTVAETAFALSESQTEELLTKCCVTYHTKVNDLLLGALAMTVKAFTGQQEVAVCMEGHGRAPIHIPADTDRTVGWFTCAYPVILRCMEDIQDAIVETKEMLRKIPNHGIGYGLLYSPQDYDEIDIYFNYIGDSEESGALGEGVYSSGPTMAAENAVGGLVNFNVSVVHDAMTFHIEANKNREYTAFLPKFAELYRQMLLKIIEHCSDSDDTYFTLGDVDADDLDESDFDEINALLGLE